MSFTAELEQYYNDFGRHDMAWRQPEPDGSFDPYKIMVSEIMLQQTQVSRVTPKYTSFLAAFPTVQALAAAPLSAVLQQWSGLGYNRRAKFLWQAAQAIGDHFPDTTADLQALPGIGPNTAGAILAYAYNQPVLYLETNIRTVLIHHFFANETAVSDKDLLASLQQQLAATSLSPREFYWALMDYGAYVKQTVGNRNRDSRSYTKQSKFEGSARQLRGRVIKLLAGRPYHFDGLTAELADDRAAAVIAGLLAESLVVRRAGLLQLP